MAIKSPKTVRFKATAAFISLFLVVLSFSSTFGQGTDSTTVLQPKVQQFSYLALPKDPVASAFFSFTLPATGQLYNHEYMRSAVFASSFYTTFVVWNYFRLKLERINTDTFFVAKYDTATGYPSGEYHKGVFQKPRDQWQNLEKKEQAVYGLAFLGMATSYIWGIIDAYQGAKRYNRELMRSDDARFGFKASLDPLTATASARLIYRPQNGRDEKRVSQCVPDTIP